MQFPSPSQKRLSTLTPSSTVGDVDAKAKKLLVSVDLTKYPSNEDIASTLLKDVPKGVHNVLVDFISRLYAVYVNCQFTYLEINPLVVIPNKDATSAEVHFLDLAAKLDQTAEFEAGVKWAISRSPAALGLPVLKSDGKVSIDAGPPMEFPAPFGRELSKEEAYIAEMDAKTGASLKLTILNPNGRVWTLVAGGGARSVSLPWYLWKPANLWSSQCGLCGRDCFLGLRR